MSSPESNVYDPGGLRDRLPVYTSPPALHPTLLITDYHRLGRLAIVGQCH